MKNILVLGGDGYLGWPIALALAAKNHNVTIMDSLAKRKWEMECGSMPLFEVLPIHRRVAIFKNATGKEVGFFIGDLRNVGAVYHIFDLVRPDLVIRCAGQPSAPFSMKNRSNAILTQEESYLSTLNVLFAIQRAEHKPHFISLGSPGTHGTGGGSGSSREAVPLDEQMVGPMSQLPGSFHDLAEASASNALSFASWNWRLAITEIRLGVVYGHATPESTLEKGLRTSFYYDAVFGTVVNRFSVQAAIGYPLTVFGSGKQTRAFISLTDVVEGIELALQHPPTAGSHQILDHFAETMTVSELARRVQKCAANAGLRTEIGNIANPRQELEDQQVVPSQTLQEQYGMQCSTLEERLNEDYFTEILAEKDRIDLSMMEHFFLWKKH